MLYGAPDMTPIATWLRETREAQRRPSDGLPWSQDDFLAALEADTGWHLHRPNYSGYETGKATPSPATLRKLVDFWAGRGVIAPDFDAPRPEPDTPMTRLAAAIEGQNAILLKLLSAVASEGELSADGRRQLRDFVAAVESAPTLSPRPTLAPLA
jgi:hypothetical protein